MRTRTKQQSAKTPAAGPLEAELARISNLNIADLRALWRSLYQEAAPKPLTGDMLARIIAYRLQEQRFGGLNRGMRRQLDLLARDDCKPIRHLKVGTVVVRAYQGAVHEVMVVPGGFRWRGQTYASLSTIARAITGTSWNGPRFFGLRGSGSQASTSEVSTNTSSAAPPDAKASSRVSVRARRSAGTDAEAKR